MKWSDKVNWYDIPESMRGGVIRYVENGTQPGHFLQAVFGNDLMEACARGDAENVRLLARYAKLLVNQCPGACFGSPGNVREWIGRGGLAGDEQHEPLPVYEWSRFADQVYRD